METKDRGQRQTSGALFDRFALSLILAVSLVLRMTIAVRGGQYFWTDESNYVRSQTAAAAFVVGHFRAGAEELFSHSDHMMFEIIGVIPAMGQIATRGLVWLPAVFFGSFSVGIVYLTSRLVRALGGSSREGLFAALLMASCASFFYYARHVFPYDLALFLYLCGALCGFRSGCANSLLAGILSGLSFLTYNSYWWFGGTVLILTVLSHKESLSSAIKRSVVTLVGLSLPILATLGIARLLGHELVGKFLHHAYLVSADAGDRGIAWRVIPEYLWVTERHLFLFLVIAFLAAFALCATGNAERRVRLWIAGSLVFYAGQVAVFDVLKVFFVCARHARPLEIFLCLIGGWFLAKIFAQGSYGRIATYLLVPAILFQAAANFSVPLRQMFPPEFEQNAYAAIAKDVSHDPGQYRILGGGYSENDAEETIEKSPHIVLYEQRHPLEFTPYSFDDYTESYRRKFHSRDISMKAVRLLPEIPTYGEGLPGSDGPWEPHGGAVRLGIVFDPGRAAASQPIISTGRKGAGDELFVQFLGPNSIRFGFDHWEHPAIFSETIGCDLKKPHLLTVSFGSLFSDGDRVTMSADLDPLWHKLLVNFDGKAVIFQNVDCYPALPHSILLFHNFIGFSTAARDFSGRLLSSHRVSPIEILKEMKANSRN
jgi:hypothetical protein